MSIKVNVTVLNLLSDPKVIKKLDTAPKFTKIALTEETNPLFNGLSSPAPVGSFFANTPSLFDVSLDYKVRVKRDFDFTRIFLQEDPLKFKKSRKLSNQVTLTDSLHPYAISLSKKSKVKSRQQTIQAKADTFKSSVSFIDIFSRITNTKRDFKDVIGMASLEVLVERKRANRFKSKVKLRDKTFFIQEKTAAKNDRVLYISKSLPAKSNISLERVKVFNTFKTERSTRVPQDSAKIGFEIVAFKKSSREKYLLHAKALQTVLNARSSILNNKITTSSDEVLIKQTLRVSRHLIKAYFDILEIKKTSRKTQELYLNTIQRVLSAKHNFLNNTINTVQEFDITRSRKRVFRDFFAFSNEVTDILPNKQVFDKVSSLLFVKPSRSFSKVDLLSAVDVGTERLTRKQFLSRVKNTSILEDVFPIKNFTKTKVQSLEQVLSPKSTTITNFVDLESDTKAKVTKLFTSKFTLEDALSNFILTRKESKTKVATRTLDFLRAKLLTNRDFVSLSAKDLTTFIKRTGTEERITHSESTNVFPVKQLQNYVKLNKFVLSPKSKINTENLKLDDSKLTFKNKPRPFLDIVPHPSDVLTYKLIKPFSSKTKSIELILPTKVSNLTERPKADDSFLSFKPGTGMESLVSSGLEILKFKRKIRLPTIFTIVKGIESTLTPKSRVILNKVITKSKFKVKPSISAKDEIIKIDARSIFKDYGIDLKGTKLNLRSLPLDTLKGQVEYYKDTASTQSSSISVKLKDNAEILKSKEAHRKNIFLTPIKSDILVKFSTLKPKHFSNLAKVTLNSKIEGFGYGRPFDSLFNISFTEKDVPKVLRKKVKSRGLSKERVIHAGKIPNLTISNIEAYINFFRGQPKKEISNLYINTEELVNKQSNLGTIEESIPTIDSGSVFYTSKGYVNGPYFLEPYVGGATTASHF